VIAPRFPLAARRPDTVIFVPVAGRSRSQAWRDWLQSRNIVPYAESSISVGDIATAIEGAQAVVEKLDNVELIVTDAAEGIVSFVRSIPGCTDIRDPECYVFAVG